MLERIKQNPAVLINAVGAAITLVVAFGLPVDGAQKAAIVGVVGAIILLVSGGAIRSQVTPMRLPKKDSKDRLDISNLTGDTADENDTDIDESMDVPSVEVDEEQ